MKSIILYFACMLVSSLGYSQISGKLVDEEKQPIEFCSIQLLSLPDSAFIAGAVSNKSGVFHFEESAHVNSFLKISYIGYETICLSAAKADIGVIQLVPLATQLKG